MNEQENTSPTEIVFGARRTLDRQQLEERRQAMIQEIVNLVDQAAPEISKTSKVVPQPQPQESNDTCLFACLISVKKAISATSGRAYLATEGIVASKARQSGLLRDGGTFGNDATARFVKHEMDLDLEQVGGDPVDKTRRILQALQEKDFPLLAYSLGGTIDHWIVVVDMFKRAERSSVIVMNPLKAQSHELISVDEFARRVMANTLTESPSASSVMIVKNPNKFVVNSVRRSPQS